MTSLDVNQQLSEAVAKHANLEPDTVKVSNYDVRVLFFFVKKLILHFKFQYVILYIVLFLYSKIKSSLFFYMRSHYIIPILFLFSTAKFQL